LFEGTTSVRVPGESQALVWCTVMAPITIGVAHIVLPSLTISEFVLLIAAGLVFVAIARGRLIGSSIRVEPRQFPELAPGHPRAASLHPRRSGQSDRGDGGRGTVLARYF
jgi:hypothetical protein